jgi:hypothetical protein
MRPPGLGGTLAADGEPPPVSAGGCWHSRTRTARQMGLVPSAAHCDRPCRHCDQFMLRAGQRAEHLLGPDGVHRSTEHLRPGVTLRAPEEHGTRGADAVSGLVGRCPAVGDQDLEGARLPAQDGGGQPLSRWSVMRAAVWVVGGCGSDGDDGPGECGVAGGGGVGGDAAEAAQQIAPLDASVQRLE